MEVFLNLFLYFNVFIFFKKVRNLKTFEEEGPENFAKENNWECVKSFPLHSMNEIEAFCKTLHPHIQEGFVIVDKNWNRRKLKSTAYVGLALINAKNLNFNEKHMLRIVRQNETDEFLVYYPQWSHLCWFVRKRYNSCIKRIVEIVKRKEVVDNQKVTNFLNGLQVAGKRG